MTVSSTTNKVSYSGNGSTTVFAYTFKIFADGDLDVYIRSSTGTETLQTLTTNYTVSNAGVEGGGNVTFVTAPATGETVVIQRKLALTQGTDYVENDPFPAESHEEALDRLTFVTQQMQEEIDRSIKASVTNTITSTEFTVSAADRASKVFAFDSSGDLAVTQELGTFQGDWAASTSYAERDLVKDTSTNNIFLCNTAHTSSGSQPLTSNTDSAKWDLIVDAAAATTSATNAASSATAAASSATAAAASATAAAASEAGVAADAAAASASASAAATSATNASNSETAAAASETAAGASETAAAASETAAAASESAAATSASNAATSESNAATSASTAQTQASNAATSASNAATSESNASTSATNASTSATAAASSATAAAASEVNAAASAASAAAQYDSFDDRYLGAKTADPALDNDGNALVIGALYFNTTDGTMKVYTSSGWVAASSAQIATMNKFKFTATAAQTAFTGLDDDSNTLSINVGAEIVTLNGVVLEQGTDYTATSSTITLTTGAALNDELNVFAFANFQVADTVSASAGGTFAADIDVTGTITADGLTLNDGTSTVEINSSNADARLDFIADRSSSNLSAFRFKNADGTPRLDIADGGDISFYEDTGTTAKFYWDSSNETLGIGSSDTAPSTSTTDLYIDSSVPMIELQDSDDSTYSRVYHSAGSFLIDVDRGNTGANSYFQVKLDDSSTDVMIFNTTGLGIGTSSPAAPLTVNHATSAGIRCESGGTLMGGFQANTSDAIIYSYSSNPIRFAQSNGGAERMRINSSGYVLVNNTSGTFNGRTFQFGIQRGGSGPNDCLSLYYATTGSTSQIIRGHSNVGGTETAVFIVRTDGDVQNTNNSYTAISDERLKQDIVDANSQWDDIKSLQVKNYRLKDRVAQSGDDAPTHLGLIAQDLEASGMSGLVTTYETEYWEEGEDLPEGVSVGDVKTEEVKTVKYSILYMKAVKALQEAMERIETLETTVADLQTRVTALEAN